MLRFSIGILLLLCHFHGICNTKIKIIDEPFSLNHAAVQAQNIAPVEKEIVSSVKPKKLSGPPHLLKLAGRCFILQKTSYKYEFCPFQNVTQRELSYRWNAFHGVLGVWKEWNIFNETFQSMSMADGELCLGHIPREVTVFLKCGDEEKVIDIEEPRTCRYNMTFETPLACPLDAFLVYPAMSDAGREEWDQLEQRYNENELTLQGYRKKQTEIFIREGFKFDGKEMKEDKKPNTESALKLKAGEIVDPNDYRLLGRTECVQKYGELLEEVERLRELLKMKGSEAGTELSYNKTAKSMIKNGSVHMDLNSNRKDGVEKTAVYVEQKSNSKRDRKDEPGDNVNSINMERGRKDYGGIDMKQDIAVKDKVLNLQKGKKGDDGADIKGKKDTGVIKKGLKLNLRRGKRGDDGANINQKLGESAVSENSRKLLNMLETSRKRLKLTDEEQIKRDKEITERQTLNHRVH